MKLIFCLSGHRFTDKQIAQLKEHLERLDQLEDGKSGMVYLELPRGVELTVHRIDEPGDEAKSCKLEEVRVRYMDEEPEDSE